MNRVKRNTRSTKRVTQTSNRAVSSATPSRSNALSTLTSSSMNMSSTMTSKRTKVSVASSSTRTINSSVSKSAPNAVRKSFSATTRQAMVAPLVVAAAKAPISTTIIAAPKTSSSDMAVPVMKAPVLAVENFQHRAPLTPVTMPNRTIMKAIHVNFTPNLYQDFNIAYMKKHLTSRGLYIEDTYYNNDICTLAVNELPADVRQDRLRRIKRAIDLDMKMKDLPIELQDYDPFVSYGLDDAYSRIEATIAERYNYI